MSVLPTQKCVGENEKPSALPIRSIFLPPLSSEKKPYRYASGPMAAGRRALTTLTKKRRIFLQDLSASAPATANDKRIHSAGTPVRERKGKRIEVATGLAKKSRPNLILPNAFLWSSRDSIDLHILQ